MNAMNRIWRHSMKNPKILMLIILASLNIGCTVNLSPSHMTGLSFAGTPSQPINTVPILWNMPVTASTATASIQSMAINPLKLNLDSVTFETNKATLTPQGEHKINEFATVIQNYGKQNVFIEGHTDSTGNTNYNQKLSERRANTVRNALIIKGISPDRLRTKGLGEENPVTTNTTSAGRQQNRRVELTILPTSTY